jgi:hypothetical protein
MNATADGAGVFVSTSPLSLTGGPTSNPIDDAGYFVHQQFLDLLGRDPDEAGWNYWTNQITQCGANATCVNSKRIEASLSFWYTAEFLQQHPGLRNPPGVSPDFNNAEFVRLCYLVYLWREPEPEGYNGWLAQLNSTNDYQSIIHGFINSAEYRLRFERHLIPFEPLPKPTPEILPCRPDMFCPDQPNEF